MGDMVHVKSQYGADFRRFSFDRNNNRSYEHLYKLLERLHLLSAIPFEIGYVDPEGSELPINNDHNFEHAVVVSSRLLRVIIHRKGEDPFSGLLQSKSGDGKSSSVKLRKQNPINQMIGMPKDFVRVSQIIDVDVVPANLRRVRLLKTGEKPLGFFIKSCGSYKMTSDGPKNVENCIFISRIVPGGLAQSTGLLGVGDEVLEVNSISVEGKTLDQVTDMMVANSSNLIVTIKPHNQNMTIASRRSDRTIGAGRPKTKLDVTRSSASLGGSTRVRAQAQAAARNKSQSSLDLKKPSSSHNGQHTSQPTNQPKTDPAQRIYQEHKRSRSARSQPSTRSQSSGASQPSGAAIIQPAKPAADESSLKQSDDEEDEVRLYLDGGQTGADKAGSAS